MDYFDQIKEQWGGLGQFIDMFFIKTYAHDLRWVIRDGEKVLQQQCFVRVILSKDTFQNSRFTNEDEKYVWLDVPIAIDIK
jgi:hypothetical protein